MNLLAKRRPHPQPLPRGEGSLMRLYVGERLTPPLGRGASPIVVS
jgi:hypothetical protein